MVGGAEKFTAQLSRALRKLGRHAIATIITDHSESDHRTERNYDILQPLFEGDIVFWPDCAPKAVQSPHVLARALNALHPREVIVINSRLGMDAIRISGNGLSQFMDLYCGYFSTGVDGLGAPYGTRYPRHTSPYAFTFTDNHRMMDELVRRFTGGSGKRVGKIPPVVHPTSDAQFERQLSRLSDRRGAKPRRWLWISRVEAWKGTHVLGRVAAQRPEEQFDIYGPLSEPLKTLGLKGQNITCHGPTPGISSMDLSAYDGFLFTSLFEGMPNVVLEIAAQHALPMVLSDVGGLRQCFMDSAIFVGVAGEIEAVAGRFSLALEKLASLHVDEVHTLVRAARRAVLNQHSEEAHLQAVASIFGAR